MTKATKNPTVFTIDQLYQNAALYEGLTMAMGSASRPVTNYFATVPLTPEVLDFLASKNIVKQGHSERMYTLVDKNPQVKVEGWAPSNYWNQKTDEKVPPQIQLYFELALCQEERGIAFWPATIGNFLSPADKLPNFRMFKAMVEWGVDNLPEIARDVAESDGHATISWTELGLGGIRTTPELFLELAGRNEQIYRLAYSNEVFSFSPSPTDALFITEPAQPAILKGWRDQLAQYRNSLVI